MCGVSHALSLFESVVFRSYRRPSSPPVSPLTGMQLEKYLATMTWNTAHLTLSLSLIRHFPPPASLRRDIMPFKIRAFVLSAGFPLSSQHGLPHSWNSWDCGDQVAREAGEMIRQIRDLRFEVTGRDPGLKRKALCSGIANHARSVLRDRRTDGQTDGFELRLRSAARHRAPQVEPPHVCHATCLPQI